MITLKKIATLKPRVQLRKIGGIFYTSSVSHYDDEYLKSVLEYLIASDLINDDDKKKIVGFYNRNDSQSGADIYYHILGILGESPADWDFVDSSGSIDWTRRIIKSHSLYLDHLRSPYNVGSIFRSAESFCVDRIYLSEGCASPEHPRAIRTSRNTVYGVDWCIEKLSNIDMPIFALELGGKDISEFEFPERGICIIGSEESGVSREALSIADSSLGRVSIGQYGAKGSINVASATAILLYKWLERCNR